MDGRPTASAAAGQPARLMMAAAAAKTVRPGLAHKRG